MGGSHIFPLIEYSHLAGCSVTGLDGFGEIYVTSLQGGRVFKIVLAP